MSLNQALRKERYERWYSRVRNIPEIYARTRASSDRSNRKIREKAVSALGGHCQCCGEVEIEFLTIDHVGGWGKYHLREGRGQPLTGSSLWREVVRQGAPRDMYQVLCMNCNYVIRYGKTCPHQTGVRNFLVAAGQDAAESGVTDQPAAGVRA